tara:strand:- start:445 stop:597 length:153 start_codon:yes stop_codon:yes gene_type:complete
MDSDTESSCEEDIIERVTTDFDDILNIIKELIDENERLRKIINRLRNLVN